MYLLLSPPPPGTEADVSLIRLLLFRPWMLWWLSGRSQWEHFKCFSILMFEFVPENIYIGEFQTHIFTCIYTTFHVPLLYPLFFSCLPVCSTRNTATSLWYPTNHSPVQSTYYEQGYMWWCAVGLTDPVPCQWYQLRNGIPVDSIRFSKAITRGWIGFGWLSAVTTRNPIK